VTVTVQIQDENYYPVKASSGNGSFTVENFANITTVGGTTTGTVADGSDFIAVSSVNLINTAVLLSTAYSQWWFDC